MKKIILISLLLAVSYGVPLVSADVGTPVAVDDFYSIMWDPNDPWTHVPGILANDYDPDGLPLSAELVSGPKHSVTGDWKFRLEPNGEFVYCPEELFLGEDTFTYMVTNGFEYSEPACVTIRTERRSMAANSVEDSYTVCAGTTCDEPAPGVLGNDFLKVDIGFYDACLIQDTEHGDLCLNSDGSFSYTPDEGFMGMDTFRYTAYCQIYGGPGDYTQVTLTVTGNEPPVAVDDCYCFVWNEVELPYIFAPGILANDIDPNGRPLTAELVSGPTHDMKFNLFSDGSFEYYADMLFLGEDSFTYRVTNGMEYSEPACVIITQKVCNYPMGTLSDAYSTSTDVTLDVCAPGILENDVCCSYSCAKLIPGRSPEHGVLSLNQDGSFTYTPDSGFVGTDSFQYAAVANFDDFIFSEYTPVTITVNGEVPNVPEFPGTFVIICGIILGIACIASRMRILR